MEEEAVYETETAVAVVETPERELQRRAERAEYAERDDRKTALAFAMHGGERNYSQRHHTDKRKPDEIVRAAETYYAFLTAGRK